MHELWSLNWPKPNQPIHHLSYLFSLDLVRSATVDVVAFICHMYAATTGLN